MQQGLILKPPLKYFKGLVMNKADELLEFLAVKTVSYTLDETSGLLGIPSELCETIVQFLAKYGFIQLKGSEMKITPEARNFVIATFPRTLELKA